MLRNNDGEVGDKKAGDKGGFTAEIWTKEMKKGTKEGKQEGERRKGGKKEGGRQARRLAVWETNFILDMKIHSTVTT